MLSLAVLPEAEPKRSQNGEKQSAIILGSGTQNTLAYHVC